MIRPADDDRDDRALLRAHVAGDPDAFGLLFARHRDRLWSVALRASGDPEDAADALQDALVSAFRRARSFRGDAAVTTWLHRIVVNACLDRHRRRRVRSTEALPEDLDHRAEATTLGRAGADPPDPSDAAVDRERRGVVLRALATLPFEQRAALVLVDMEGYSVDEAAAILDCAPGTVKSRCFRGRARLAPLLAGQETGGGAGNPHPRPRVEPRGGPTGSTAEEVAGDDS